MSVLSKVLRQPASGCLSFWCPGCGVSHSIRHGAGPGPRWGWNGDVERPTFTPSVLVRTGRAVDPDFVPMEGDPPEVCHTFVTDGKIQFLGDCTHALAGQTVPLAEFPEGWGC